MPDNASPHPWLASLLDGPAVSDLCDRLRAGRPVVAEGSMGSSTTLLAGALAAKLDRPVLLVVAHLDDADDAAEDLELLRAAGHALNIRRLSALEILPGETGVNLELLAERLSVVEELHHNSLKGASVHVAPIQALMQAVPQADAVGDFSLTLSRGKRMPPGQLLEWLDRAGYTRVDAIEQPGDFALRGGIVDIFAPSGRLILDEKDRQSRALRARSGLTEAGSDKATSSSGASKGGASVDGASGGMPVRVDFFGDEIDTLTLINTDTMGSGAPIVTVQLIGASPKQLQADGRTTNFVSLLPKDAVIVLHEVLELSEQARGYYERLTDARGIFSPNALMKLLTDRPHVRVHQYGSAGPGQGAVKMPVRTLMSFDRDAGKAVDELIELTQTDSGGGKSRVVVLCANDAEKTRLAELLTEHTSAPGSAPGSNAIALEIGYLHRGFVWEDASASLHLVPHHELFHRYRTRRRIRRVSSAAERASDAFLDLEVGDYVVHVDHGIARFVGLKTMRRNNASQDYLTLEFAEKALLHVPATQIDLIQKYVGGFQGRPPLSVLGGKRWAKQKQEAAAAAKDLAAQLIRLQAARASLPGVRFPGDTAWQKEFEAEFPYEETEDQLAAIAEIKKDMSDEQPMDRLICGDVGFGKTEVAIRAAFKAVEFGKQVAVLVPTTVLAEQHERTFTERMADYPFKVASISRFKTAGEQKALLEQLAAGRVDVIIGTHRLLSADVKFTDLGLVVIDEEQRFGVEHKQKLLQFRMTADVLTLSATPIPRTLHMAMLGLRDISSLSTAPTDRRAIVTEVVPYERQRVKQAILRELSRDGQVYFVHNRVHNIQSVADEIQKLVPDARIAVGHGQMPSHELEDVMLRFMRRQVDILVCTTIIESGLDIPTANTIFIHEADHYGLADLHQLRGRVGRSKHRAYCYLLLPEDRPITDTAQRRMRAIEQYAMLGAGFKIAMRDLEIRGAGNLLGAEQSGHIAAVGYEMYCKLLEQEARQLRQEKIVEPVRTHLELPTAGRIPQQYVPSEKHRMDAYKRLSRAANMEELEQLTKDLIDAYGKPPESVQSLFDLAELRIAASTLGVRMIRVDGPDVILRADDPRKVERAFISSLTSSSTRDHKGPRVQGRVTVLDDKTVYYRPPANYLESPETLLAVLRKALSG